MNTLLTGTLGRLTGRSATARVVADGRTLIFDATVISAKPHRLRGEFTPCSTPVTLCDTSGSGLSPLGLRRSPAQRPDTIKSPQEIGCCRFDELFVR